MSESIPQAKVLGKPRPRAAAAAKSKSTDGDFNGRATQRPHVRMGQEFTRKQLLGTVYEFISENGIENLSMRRIAEAAGVSTGTINYHFVNKQRLLIAALESAYELPPDWESYKGSPLKQLTRLVTGYVCRAPRDRFWRFWVNYLATSTRDSELHAHQTDRYRRQLRFWAKLIEDGARCGEVRTDIDPHRRAEELLILAHGLLIRQLAGPEEGSRDLAHELLMQQIEQIRLIAS